MQLRGFGSLILWLGPVVLAESSLKPWEILHLSTFSPPGRPGDTQLHSNLNFTISDPNDSTVSPTTCVAKWLYDELPYNQTNACDVVSGGQWTFEMLESDNNRTASPTTDFKLRFELTTKDARCVGMAKFTVGDNLSGMCSAGGICGFALKDEDTPFAVQQARV